MKNQKGFIQIPILIAIIIGIFVVGGIGYIAIKQYQYQNHQTAKNQGEVVTQNKQATSTDEISEIEKLRQEVEILKAQKSQVITRVITKEVSPPNTKAEPPQEKNNTATLIYTQNQSQAPNITEIVGNWRFFTAKVEDVRGLGWGSGLIIKSADGNFKILTNKHVVEEGTAFNIKLPGNPTDNILQGSVIYRGSEDFATISLGNSNEYLKDLISGDAYHGICSENQKPILGDEILILGYPAIGSQTDVTVTKGIISGFERGYFITDAKIDHGNSGGVAINIKYNCYFGPPTYGVSQTETLGRILDIWRVAGQF